MSQATCSLRQYKNSNAAFDTPVLTRLFTFNSGIFFLICTHKLYFYKTINAPAYVKFCFSQDRDLEPSDIWFNLAI